MLDIKKELKNYPVIDIDLVTKRDPSIPDSIKNSMVLYNKALDSLHMNNDDMAIIKLKKAIAMNPSFYEAMNLLGVIHSGSGDNEKAKKVFQEVIDAEGNSIKAQNYIALINGSVPDESSGKLKKGYNVKTVDNKELKLTFKQMIFYSFKKDALKYIIGIVLGVVAGLLIFGLQEKPDFTEERNKYESQLEEKNNEYNTLKEKNNLLESEKNRAEEKIIQKERENEILKSSEQLFEIETMIDEGKLVEAAKKLELIKDIDLTEKAKARFDYLYSGTLKKAAAIMYDNGRNLIKAGDFQGALENLLPILDYDPDYKSPSNVLYWTGYSYMQLKEYNDAKLYFQKVIDEYPGYNTASYSRARLREIEKEEQE